MSSWWDAALGFLFHALLAVGCYQFGVYAGLDQGWRLGWNAALRLSDIVTELTDDDTEDLPGAGED